MSIRARDFDLSNPYSTTLSIHSGDGVSNSTGIG